MAKNPHAVALGRLGGKVSSPAKAKAARKNATRPRPGRRKRPDPVLEQLSADLDRLVAPVLARLRKRSA